MLNQKKLWKTLYSLLQGRGFCNVMEIKDGFKLKIIIIRNKNKHPFFFNIYFASKLKREKTVIVGIFFYEQIRKEEHAKRKWFKMVDFQQLKDKNIDRNGGAKRSYRLVKQTKTWQLCSILWIKIWNRHLNCWKLFKYTI